jgi:D-lactate dehydrogenase
MSPSHTPVAEPAILDPTTLGPGVTLSERRLDRFAMAHDASHYLLIPEAIATPATTDDVVRIFRASHADGRAVTFRSGGTSLSGQGISDSILVDTRRGFQRVDVLDRGERVRVQPGVTVRRVNAGLLRFGRKLGPDPASEIACTIGGVIANNSSGMACGVEQNSYRTLESMVIVLPSGTVVDTAEIDADEQLAEKEPVLHTGLGALRSQLLANPDTVAEIRRLYSIKNTMGYGLNSFVDFERPVDILAHLLIGSEGTLGFVAEATFRTVEILPHVLTGLLVFSDLHAATAVLPALVAAGFATIELMDAQSLRVAQAQPDCPPEIAELSIEAHAAYLVELQSRTAEDLAERARAVTTLLDSMKFANSPSLTGDPASRAALWHTRKGIYPAVAGARPSGTTALLEDIAVPIDRLLATCGGLIELFAAFGYEDSVIFGHAKDGNIHFMLNERFDDPQHLDRYRRFTEAMVDLVLRNGGTLKAEHGTGRIMAPFVERQYGGQLFGVMCAVKRLCDPLGLLNPGVLLSRDPESYLENLKTAPTVESEVDRCVECGYCEPACPSKNLTLTPRQRIVLRREMEAARAAGDLTLLAELRDDYAYDGVETCAVDGMCKTACPVAINTGDLVRRLRAESRGGVEQLGWAVAADRWKALSTAGGVALGVAKKLPPALPIAATRLGRAVLGDEVVPLYSAALPSGGQRRPRPRAGTGNAVAVYFASCISSMFGPADGGRGVVDALLALCARAGVELVVPEGLDGMCCGTPWKSKGYLDGYARMRELVLPALFVASRGGKLPIVCDAASCTEGLKELRAAAQRAGGEYAALRFVDSIEFVADRVLLRLTVERRIGSVTVHNTCSTTTLGVNGVLEQLAAAVADEIHVPVDWGCCAFAGDRGLLHPELTASATSAEAAEIHGAPTDAYVSANRTCELGMTSATGKNYRHILELLEEATRPVIK